MNTTITSVALVLPSNYARTYQTKGITKVNSPQDKIEVSDIVRVLKIAQRFEKSKKEEIVSTIPVKYLLDTKEEYEPGGCRWTVSPLSEADREKLFSDRCGIWIFGGAARLSVEKWLPD